MKLAISNIAWDVAEDDEILELLSARGIRGIEVAPTKVWNPPAEATREAVESAVNRWRRYGLEVVAFQALLYGHPELAIFQTPELREATYTALDSMMRLAARAGAKVLVFGSPRNRLVGEVPADCAFGIAVEFFGRVGARAAELGVCFCIEPNPPQYGCDFIHTAREGRDLVERVGSPGFRLHLDASAMTLNGENYEESIEACFDCLEHFHISEPQLAVVGECGTEHERIAAALRRLGYGGWVSIEMRNGQKHPDRLAVESALAYAGEVYGG